MEDREKMRNKKEKRGSKKARSVITGALVLGLCGAVAFSALSYVDANTYHTAYSKSYYISKQSNLSAGEYKKVKSECSKVLLVNKENPLPVDYVPENLVVPDVEFNASVGEEKTYMDKEAAAALEQLFAAGEQDGIRLVGISGYRSYGTQYNLYYRSVYRNGADYANVYSARAGYSEHQTGLAIDVSSASAGYGLVTSFATTKEGIWLAENCADYGFIVRYPEGKTDITGYAYEPWHIRYVGVRAAKYLLKHEITLDEYQGALAYERYTNLMQGKEEATTEETTTQETTTEEDITKRNRSDENTTAENANSKETAESQNTTQETVSQTATTQQANASKAATTQQKTTIQKAISAQKNTQTATTQEATKSSQKTQQKSATTQSKQIEFTIEKTQEPDTTQVILSTQSLQTTQAQPQSETQAAGSENNNAEAVETVK